MIIILGMIGTIIVQTVVIVALRRRYLLLIKKNGLTGAEKSTLKIAINYVKRIVGMTQTD